MPAAARAHRWPCPQCGSQMQFAPGKEELACAHCGHRQPMQNGGPWREQGALGEIPLRIGLAQAQSGDLTTDLGEDIRASQCPNCGALVEFSGAEHASRCPYCDTPVVVDTGVHRHIKPQALLPFDLTEDQARQALTHWLGRLWFAPSGLRAYARKGRAMTGLYTPFWTFDAATVTQYRGAKGVHYYETRNVTVQVNGRSEQRRQQVQRTRWYPASGQVARKFDDVITLASTSLPQRLGQDLTPWDLSGLRPFHPDYLAGFAAEGYTISLPKGWQSAQGIMARVIEGDVRADIGGDVQRIDHMDTNYSHETFKHVLLPIWTAAYKYNGQSYRFLVNGQTGEVQGERPYSAWKIAFALAVAAIIGLGVLYLNDPASLGLPRPAWMDW